MEVCVLPWAHGALFLAGILLRGGGSRLQRQSRCAELAFFLLCFELCGVRALWHHFWRRDILTVGVLVPGVGGQLPGNARLLATLMALKECRGLFCRLQLCFGAFVCAHVRYWNRFRFGPESTGRALGRDGCSRIVIFPGRFLLDPEQSCLWQCR
ncbi:hypothetical protein TcCL_Unassigned01200 [Trypanosoma cruzi]|nr:hypothetical protein TcCL_Unassigned01200 [Trypanosoma cruzi]